jgi:hypothetical protein
MACRILSALNAGSDDLAVLTKKNVTIEAVALARILDKKSV